MRRVTTTNPVEKASPVYMDLVSFSCLECRRQQLPDCDLSPTGILAPNFQPRVNLYLCVCVRMRAQSCPTLCDPMDCSLLGSSVHGIL